MTRGNNVRIPVLSLLILSVVIAHAQSPAPQFGPAKATGSCAVAHSGNYDTIYITNCGIGEEQGKKLEDLLKQILAKNDLADANAKLDQLLKIVSSLGPPHITMDTPKDLPESPEGHPRQSFNFIVDRPDEGGQFGVVCDRACVPVQGCTLQGPNPLTIGFLIDDPTIAVFLFQRQFPSLTVCNLTVESTDRQPIKIVTMKHLYITDAKSVKLNAKQPNHCVVAGGSTMC